MNKVGITLQKHSDGAIRGRLFLPNGKAVDVHDHGEGQNWWTKPTGTRFQWIER